MPKPLDFSVVSTPQRGSSIQDQAVAFQAEHPIPRSQANDFVRAVAQGLEEKGSPLETRIAAFKAVAAGDTTQHAAVKRAASLAIYDLKPSDKEASLYVGTTPTL